MDFVISGAAGKPDNQIASGITSSATSSFVAATGGFAAFDVTATTMTVKMIDYTGAELYTFTRDQSRVANKEYFDWNTEFGTNYVNFDAEAARIRLANVEVVEKQSFFLSLFDTATESTSVLKFSLMFSGVTAVLILILVASTNESRSKGGRVEVVFAPDSEHGPAKRTVKDVVAAGPTVSVQDGMEPVPKRYNLRSMVAAATEQPATVQPSAIQLSPAAALHVQRVRSPVRVLSATSIYENPETISPVHSSAAMAARSRLSTVTPSKRTQERKERLGRLVEKGEMMMQPILQHRYELQEKAKNPSRHPRVPHRLFHGLKPTTTSSTGPYDIPARDTISGV
jgi:hypothetical protein